MAPSKLAKKSTTSTDCIKSVEQQQQKMKKKTTTKKKIQHRRIVRFEGGWPFPDKNSSHWFLVDEQIINEDQQQQQQPKSEGGDIINNNKEVERKAADKVIRKKRQLMWERHSWKDGNGGYMGITFDDKAAYDAFLVYAKKFVPPQLQW